MAETSALYWSIRQLTDAFARGELTPADITDETLARIESFDHEVRAYVTVTADLARSRARTATEQYRRGERGPLLGVPISIKDAFHLADTETTLGSLTQRGWVSRSDSGVVARLRAAGAVLPGKTNVPEFCQSATNENRLGPDTGNPWDLSRTPGGSSGGAAASVAAGLASAAVGSDGGGSIRIPSAFCGLVGFKPSVGSCLDERGFRAMTDFVSPGPLTSTVDDARIMSEILAERTLERRPVPPQRIAFCARPEGHPVDPAIIDSLGAVAAILSDLGHDVVECDVPIGGWNDIFGPLVLDDELRERQHLLHNDSTADQLTRYESATLRAAKKLCSSEVRSARAELAVFRAKVDEFLHSFDALLTPSTATVAFPHRERPTAIDATEVDRLWGAFPFTAPFNVAGTPAITVPTTVSNGLPIGAQLVAAHGRDEQLLNLAESLEKALQFDYRPLHSQWHAPASKEPVG